MYFFSLEELSLNSFLCIFFVGQCAEPVTTGGVTRTISCDVLGSNLFTSYFILLLASTCFLQSSSVWSISSSGWMEQMKIVLLAFASFSPVVYIAKKLVALVTFTVLITIIEVALVVALSSKIVPFVYHTIFRTIHTLIRQRSNYATPKMMRKTADEFTSLSSRTASSSSRTSTTCYEGGGGETNSEQVMRE